MHFLLLFSITASIGSRLKQSFTNINRSTNNGTPVERFSLVEETEEEREERLRRLHNR